MSGQGEHGGSLVSMLLFRQGDVTLLFGQARCRVRTVCGTS